jgi:DNA ligase-1
MQALAIIRALTGTSSRVAKEQILLDAFMTGQREIFIGARMACDPLTTFGVKQVAVISEDDGEPGDFAFVDFLRLADLLRTRQLTGNAARDAIRAAAERCHAPTWNEFYRRILLKDLKAGVQEATINKVLSKLAGAYPEARDLMIPDFACQLSHDGTRPEHAKKVKGRKMVDVKLDGVRLLTILDKQNGTVTQFTRDGAVNDRFDDIRAALASLMALLPGSVVLDGEVVARSFRDLMTQLNRKENANTSEAKLALFDIIPLADFRRGRCDQPQSLRHEALTALIPMLAETAGERVYVIPKLVVDLDTEEGLMAFSEYNRAALEAGYEGVMIKDPDGAYEGKKTAVWLKCKPFIEVSLAVVGVIEGEPDSKYRGMMGAFLCRGEDDGRQIEVSVGSGFTDVERADFWNRRDELIGMVAEVRADAMSIERGSEVWSLRFPRFKGWRGSLPGQKL